MGALTEVANNSVTILKKHAPEILMVTGLGLGAGAIGYSIYKGGDITNSIKDYKFNVETIKISRDMVLDDYDDMKPDYNIIKANLNKEVRKDILKETGVMVKDVLKVSWPIIALEAGCVGCCLASNRLQATQIDKLSRDLAAVTGAYTVLDKLFRKYRENVKVTYGEEADELMRNGVIVEENGKRIVKLPSEITDEQKKGWESSIAPTKDMCGYDLIWGEDAGSIYSYKRSENLYDYVPDHNANYITLKRYQTELRDALRAPHSYITVNDIYKKYGYSKFCTQAGQVVGFWNDSDHYLNDDEVAKILDLKIDSCLNDESIVGDEPSWYLSIDPMGIVLDHIGPANVPI